jgi:hypothetical protein
MKLVAQKRSPYKISPDMRLSRRSKEGEVFTSGLEAVVAHEAAPRARSGLGLDEALSSLKGAAARRDQLFKEQIKAEQKKPQVLQKKFEEGLKKAKDSPDPPLNPMDMD